MKEGDRIVCMCGADNQLTIHKIYEVFNTFKYKGINKVLIRDDSGILTYIPEYVFILQDEFRENRITKIFK